MEGAYGSIAITPTFALEPSALEPVDWVLLATKTQDTPGTAPWLKRLCGPHTVLAVLQNGVDQVERATPFAGPAEVLPTVVYANASRLPEGRIRHLCPESDLLVPATRAGNSLSQLFEGTPLLVKTEPEFTTSSWQKFLVNVVANPLTAISNRGIEVFRGGAMEDLAFAILSEAVEVGRACGAKFGPETAKASLQWMSKYPGDTITSMLQDRRDGRPLESAALNGTVVRLGLKHRIPTPVNQSIFALLQSIG